MACFDEPGGYEVLHMTCDLSSRFEATCCRAWHSRADIVVMQSGVIAVCVDYRFTCLRALVSCMCACVRVWEHSGVVLLQVRNCRSGFLAAFALLKLRRLRFATEFE